MPAGRWDLNPNRLLLLLGLVFGFGLVAFYVLFFLPGQLYWQDHRGFRTVTAPARILSVLVEDFRAVHGRYPRTLEEYGQLGAGQGRGRPYLESLLSGPRIGHRLTEVIVTDPSNADPSAPLLVVSGGAARVEIYRGGRVGMTENLRPYPRGEPPPAWLTILPSDQQSGR